MNDLNFARFDAKLDQRLAQFGAELREAMRTDSGEVRKEMYAGFARLEERISSVRSDLMKWSFVFWVGAVAAIAVLAGVLR